MDQIEEIRSKTDITKLISEYVTLQKSGRSLKALCPFHSEKAPSFMVSPQRQIFKCFGCQEGGDVFSFLMKIEGMEFGEALRTLAKRAGVELATYHPTAGESEKDKLFKVNQHASDFYHFLLTSHPIGKKALDYLINRGISKKSIDKFKLGYAPNFAWSLQKYMTLKKGHSLDDLKKAGLVNFYNNSARDFFRDRVIFPLSNHRGQIVGFSGRTIGAWSTENALKTGPKYINTPETLIYHKSELLYGLDVTKKAISTQNKAILVEGEFDVISSHQAGVENVVAIKGSALTESQVRLLKRFTENFVLALDRDLSGDAASRRGIEIADQFGVNLQVVEIPQGKDPDELAQKSPILWQKTVEKAIGIYDFYLNSALSRYDAKTPPGQRKISEELLPVFNKISNEIIKAHYTRLLAKKLEVPESAVAAQMAKIGKSILTDLQTKTIQKTARLRQEILEEYLLALCFQENDVKLLTDPDIQKLITTPVNQKILKVLGEFLQGNQEFMASKFASYLPAELVEIYNNFYLLEIDEKLLDETVYPKEKERILKEIEKIQVKAKLKELTILIAGLEKEDQEEELEKAKKDFNDLSKKLSSFSEG